MTRADALGNTAQTPRSPLATTCAVRDPEPAGCSRLCRDVAASTHSLVPHRSHLIEGSSGKRQCACTNLGRNIIHKACPWCSSGCRDNAVQRREKPQASPTLSTGAEDALPGLTQASCWVKDADSTRLAGLMMLEALRPVRMRRWPMARRGRTRRFRQPSSKKSTLPFPRS